MPDAREDTVEAPPAARAGRRWWPWAVPGSALALILVVAARAEIASRRRARAIGTLSWLGRVEFEPAAPRSWLGRLLAGRGEPDRRVSLVQLFYDSVSDETLEHAARIPELRALSLSGAALTDAGLARIAGLRELRHLAIEGARVTDAGLVHLEGFSEIETLGIIYTPTGDAGLAHLAGLARLEELDLSYTRVTDAGLDHLAGLSRLRRLDLRGTEVTGAGAARLRASLPEVEIILE